MPAINMAVFTEARKRGSNGEGKYHLQTTQAMNLNYGDVWGFEDAEGESVVCTHDVKKNCPIGSAVSRLTVQANVPKGTFRMAHINDTSKDGVYKSNPVVMKVDKTEKRTPISEEEAEADRQNAPE